MFHKIEEQYRLATGPLARLASCQGKIQTKKCFIVWSQSTYGLICYFEGARHYPESNNSVSGRLQHPGLIVLTAQQMTV